jgi:hypothetical protein
MNKNHQEIGRILNISVNTIKWRLQTVRKRYPEYWANARSIRAAYRKHRNLCKSASNLTLTELRLLERRGKTLARPQVIDSISLVHLDYAIDRMILSHLLSKMSRTK